MRLRNRWHFTILTFLFLVLTQHLSAQLPTGWLDQDVGTVGVAGSASYTSGTFTVSGAGAGVNSGSTDAFHFVYQPVSGDGSIVARVVSVPSGSYAGLMVRETLDAGSANASVSEWGYASTYGYVYYYDRASAGSNESGIVGKPNLGIASSLPSGRMTSAVN